MSPAEKEYSAPIVDEDSGPFWQAASEGRLLIKYCNACEKPHWYPRPRCPFCLGEDTIWQEAAGTGAIYSYSVMRRVAKPYVVAFVSVDEGPSILTNIVDCDIDRLHIGMKVAAAFRPVEGGAILVFRPVEEGWQGHDG
ncbi:Zn-ribbon domain-containing OB-fold protein [Pollutimonas bauzanensis]|uniref:DNA-binding protein n=1 Tax=Pollutimonas bauzanensis TaxID=658167 RepID=A0A1M5X2Q4_9BURK|nr:OB-fold domain-containing protein [Pollutimonas bauzanensis]SHH94099.1 hypothetical protein SAMN04488135_106109 [Pollutimonas bauzanensis]